VHSAPNGSEVRALNHLRLGHRETDPSGCIVTSPARSRVCRCLVVWSWRSPSRVAISPTERGAESKRSTIRTRKLDLKPGGELIYTMTATAPEQVEFMRSAGMPLSPESRKTFTEVQAPTRLVYSSLVDFVPNVEPYEFMTVVDLTAQEKRVDVVMTVERLHDEVWTGRLIAGRENELDNLAKALSPRRP